MFASACVGRNRKSRQDWCHARELKLGWHRRISPTTSNQCFTPTLYSETRFDHVLCSPKQGHVSLHCPQHASPRLLRSIHCPQQASPCLQQNTLISKQDKPKIGQEKRYKRDEFERRENQRIEIESQRESFIVTQLCRI